MPSISIRNVSNYALANISMDVNDGEFMVVLGPSGAGKTTLLNVVAGLVPYRGSVVFDGAPMDRLKPSERGVGYVPQDLALFNHLRVKDNIAFGLKMRGLKADEIDRRIAETMDLLNIRHLAHRYPLTLSGGEQQRVAIARALVLKPNVLLMDEPFSNLDTSIRRILRMELKNLQAKLKVTTIFVTHDVVEAEELANRVAILVGGELRCVGKFEEVFFNSTDPAVRSILGNFNVLSCDGFRVVHDGLAEVRHGDIKLLVPHDDGVITRIAIPPEKIVLSKELNPKMRFNTLKCTVEEVDRSGSLYRITVTFKGTRLLVVRSHEAFSSAPLSTGDQVYVKMPIRHIKTFSTH